MSSTQHEARLLREMAQALHNAGIAFNHLANYYDGESTLLTGGEATASAANAPPAPGGMPPPPPFPAAPGTPPAPGAVAGGAAAGGRKRRTKAQIEADETAVKAGFVDAADMAARQGNGGSVPVSGMPSAPNVPGNLPPPVPGAVANVPPPPPPATPPAPVAPVTTSHDNLQAALIAFGQAVENTWPGQGHGNGQMGLVVKKMNVPNIQAIPAENVEGWTNWVLGITAEFRADPSKLASLTA